MRCFNFFHKKEIFRRDISYSNILTKEFELIKLKENILTDFFTKFRVSLNNQYIDFLVKELIKEKLVILVGIGASIDSKLPS